MSKIRLGRYRNLKTGRQLFITEIYPPDEKFPEGSVKIRQLYGAYYQTRRRSVEGFFDQYERWDF